MSHERLPIQVARAMLPHVWLSGLLQLAAQQSHADDPQELARTLLDNNAETRSAYFAKALWVAATWEWFEWFNKIRLLLDAAGDALQRVQT